MTLVRFAHYPEYVYSDKSLINKYEEWSSFICSFKIRQIITV